MQPIETVSTSFCDEKPFVQCSVQRIAFKIYFIFTILFQALAIFNVRFHHYYFPFIVWQYGIPRKHFRSSNVLLFCGIKILQTVCFDHFVDHFEMRN